MHDVAIAILNYNGKKFLDKFLPDVIKHSKTQASIYIIDNASTDDSVNFLETNFPDIQLIKLSFNGGFAKGYNEGLKYIKAIYYVLLNSDVEVTPDWIKPVIDLMQTDSQIACCQPKIKSYHNKNLFEYAGAAGGYIDKYGYPFCRGRIFNSIEEDKDQYNSKAEIFWASGACMFLRSEVFHKMNGFDEEFFAHMEEIDLCWRMHNSNYKIMYCPSSVVYHVGGGTLAVSNPYKTYLNFRNNLLMLCKNVPRRNLVSVLFVRLLLDGIAGIKFLFTNGWKYCLAIIKAHLYLYTNFQRQYKKREEKNISFPKLTYNKNLVLEYYFKGKKTFNDLNWKPK